MYHAHFRGTHYEAGFRWGSLLLKHKNIILENIPFEITQERIDYACLLYTSPSPRDAHESRMPSSA